jgi:transposase-like protein
MVVAPALIPKRSGERIKANRRDGVTLARHEHGLRRNKWAERLPVRRRERKMQRFKSPGSAQRFLSVHAAVHNAFNVHAISFPVIRSALSEAKRFRIGGRRPRPEQEPSPSTLV